jgi:O-antigen ligase/Flp pilus assembly protein TadD
MALVALVPVAFDPWGWDRFSPVKWLVAAAVAAAGVTVVGWRGALVDRRALTTAWLVVLGVALASTLAARDPLLAFLGDSSRLYGWVSVALVFAAYLCGCAAGGRARWVARAAVAGAAAVVAYGLAQMAGVDPLRWASSLDLSRARSTLGNAAFLGGYLTLVLPIAACLARDPFEPGRWRVAHAAVLVGGVVVMAGTKTRGAWVGLGAGLGLCWCLARRRRAGADRSRMRATGRAAVAAAASAALAAVVLLTPVGPRALSSLDPSSGTAAGRLDTWHDSLALVGRRPALGWGPEGFRTGFPEVVSMRWVQRYGQGQIQDRAHNLLLDTAVSTGVAGLLAYAGLLAALGAAARAALRHGGLEVVGVLGGLAAHLVSAQFLFDTFDLAVVFWVLAGVVAVQAPASRWHPPRTARAGVAAAAVAAVAWGSVGVVADHRVRAAAASALPSRAVEGLAAAARLRPRALEYHLLAGRVAVERGDPVTLATAHRLLSAWSDPDVHLADAEVLSRLGSVTGDIGVLAEAADAYRAVARRQPHSGLAWLGLGQVEVRLGRSSQARAALTDAAGLLPRSPDAHLALGLLDVQEGRITDAASHLRAASRIAPDDPRLLELAQELSKR